MISLLFIVLLSESFNFKKCLTLIIQHIVNKLVKIFYFISKLSICYLTSIFQWLNKDLTFGQFIGESKKGYFSFRLTYLLWYWIFYIKNFAASKRNDKKFKERRTLKLLEIQKIFSSRDILFFKKIMYLHRIEYDEVWIWLNCHFS